MGTEDLRNSRHLPVVVHFPAPFTESEGRPYQLSQHLAELRPVVYVAQESAMAPSVFRIMPRMRSLGTVGAVEVIDQELGRGYHALRRRRPGFAGILNNTALTRAMARFGVRNFWTYTMGAFEDWAVPRRRVLRGVEVIDPFFTENASAAWEVAASIAGKADLLVTTATDLADELSSRGLTSFDLPNAVSASLIAEGRPAPTGQPTALYVGTVDWRFDARLLAQVARHLPNCRFVVAGRINTNMENELRDLRTCPNVNIRGVVSEKEKILLLSSAQVGLVPFKPGPVSDGVNPTKVYEYSAYGLPVVAVDSRACHELSPPIRVAGSAQQFTTAINDALDEGPRSARCFAFARANTWRHRAENLHALLQKREAELLGTRGSLH